MKTEYFTQQNTDYSYLDNDMNTEYEYNEEPVVYSHLSAREAAEKIMGQLGTRSGDYRIGFDQNGEVISIHNAFGKPYFVFIEQHCYLSDIVDDVDEDKVGSGDEEEIAACIEQIEYLLDRVEGLHFETDNEKIDCEDNDMETITLQRGNDRDMEFVGELVAEESSSSNNASGAYSGAAGRWSELRIYRTKSGRLICEQVGRTQWQGEHDRHSARVCDTDEEIVDFFGHGWLAKRLYDSAGIKNVEVYEITGR
jgi:hypothetical protein